MEQHARSVVACIYLSVSLFLYSKRAESASNLACCCYNASPTFGPIPANRGSGIRTDGDQRSFFREGMSEGENGPQAYVV